MCESAISTLRILSRERAGFEVAFSTSSVDSLANHAGLGLIVPIDFLSSVVLEAYKLLSNLQVHDPKLREYLAHSHYIDAYYSALKVTTLISYIRHQRLVLLLFLCSQS